MNRICHMFMTSLVFTGAFLIIFDGRFAIFGELYLLHVGTDAMCFAFHGLFVF